MYNNDNWVELIKESVQQCTQKCHEQHTQQLQHLHNQMCQNTSKLTDWVCAQVNYMEKQLNMAKCSDLEHLKKERSTENAALITHYNSEFSLLKQDTELKLQDTENYLKEELSAISEILEHLMARERELNAINSPVGAGRRAVVAQSRLKHKRLSTAGSSRVLRSSSQPKSLKRRYDLKTHSILEQASQ